MSPTTPGTKQVDDDEIDDVKKKESIDSSDAGVLAVSPVKKRQAVPIQPRAPVNGDDAHPIKIPTSSTTTVNDLNNSTSPVVPSASSNSSSSAMHLHSTSTLNQSVMATNPAIANLSMSTAGDSFNVSSSGYNGSSSNTFNLSMDSVVDKFNDE